MTMTWAKWQSLTDAERDAQRSTAGLTPELVGLEGWRVEATFKGLDKPERFIVSRSTGWVPVHIMLKRRDSSGGMQVWSKLTSVKPLYRAKGGW